MKQKLQNLQSYYEKNEHQFAIGFFIGGFLLDMVMLARIDSWETIGQHIFYLLTITVVLMQMFFEQTDPPTGESKSLLAHME